MSGFDLLGEAWVPTEGGDRPLVEALTGDHPLRAGEPRAHAAVVRLAALIHAHGGARTLRREAFDLFGARPFMQLPPHLTAELPEVSVASLLLTRASGDEATRFSMDLDDRPRPLTPAEAALGLLSYQQFAPSRGRSRWAYTSDAPLARRAVFLAEGDSLAQSAALNAPDGPLEAPFWAQTPDWSLWRGGAPLDLTPGTALAYPWWGVTLTPGAAVRWVRLTSGPKASGVDDPHVHASAVNARSGEVLYAKNPLPRSAETLLVNALLAALRGEASAPLGFRRALEGGARWARVTVQTSRNGQPVVLDRLEAALPWPTVAPGAALGWLEAAQLGAVTLEAAVRTALSPVYSRDAADAAGWLAPLRAYWQAVGPALAGGLVGEGAVVDFAPLCREAAHAAFEGVAGPLGARETAVMARNIGRAGLRPLDGP